MKRSTSRKPSRQASVQKGARTSQAEASMAQSTRRADSNDPEIQRPPKGKKRQRSSSAARVTDSDTDWAYYSRLVTNIQWNRQIDTTQELIRHLAAQYYASRRALSRPRAKKQRVADVRGKDVLHPASVLYRSRAVDVQEEDDNADEPDSFRPSEGSEEEVDEASPPPKRKVTPTRDKTVYMENAFDRGALEVMAIYFEESIHSLVGEEGL